MIKFSLIAAADKNMGIGKDNKMPWRLKGEMKYFTETTLKAPEGKMNAVVMGYNTWLSLPAAHRPLKERLNVVLSKEPVELPDGVINAQSFDEAFSALEKVAGLHEVFIIGGASIYAQAILLPGCSRIYLTELESVFDCDTFFPKIDPAIFSKKCTPGVEEEGGVRYRFCVYEKDEL